MRFPGLVPLATAVLVLLGGLMSSRAPVLAQEADPSDVTGGIPPKTPAKSGIPGAPVGGAARRGPEALLTVLQVDAVANGIATTADNRIFLPLSHLDGSTGPQAVEWKNGAALPYPDAGWNSWHPGEDAAGKFVRVNALRVGPQGALWIVDVGAPGLNTPKVPHGPKIVKVDLATNGVSRVYDLDGATNDKSFIDDIRFHGSLAYITDAGSPGLIILDTASGNARRVLDGDPSVTAQRPMSVDDHVLRGPDGKGVSIHADQLEVSPDGRFFYYQPASGPMSRIATRYLDDPKLPEAQLANHVSTFARTRSTGGTAIDATGAIYTSDLDKHRVLKIDPSGSSSVLIEDPRLLWVDAMWIDDRGFLYMPAAQLDRMAPFNGGVSKVTFPVTVYKMKIDAEPSSEDHP